MIKALSSLFRIARVCKAYREGMAYLNYPPIALWIELTNHCNLRCSMCPNSVLDKGEKGFMNWDIYQKVIDEAKDFILNVNLWLGGESLLHPDISRMVTYAGDNGLITAINTNATLLDEKKSREIIASHLDVLTFSFDGYDKKSHEEKRVGSDFEKALANIINFLKIKKELRSSKPYTILANLIFSSKLAPVEIRKYRDLYKQFRILPMDEINFRRAHTWGDVFARDRSFTPTLPEDKFSPCSYLWSAMNILWDGRVVPCCNDFTAEYELGRVGDRSLASIWNDRPMLNLRRAMVRGKYLTLKKGCRHCHVLWDDRVFGLPTGWRGIMARALANLFGFKAEKAFKRLAGRVKPSFGFSVKR